MRKKKSLKGLHGIYVVVEDLGPEMRGKITRREIREKVENRLKWAGIRTFHAKEAAKSMGEPYLYVNIAALPQGQKKYACRIDLEVHQLVTLVHNSSQGHAITWDSGVVTVGDVQEILDYLDELVFDFIYDYLAVNPNS